MKLLASDYDGTLLRNRRIDKGDIEAIERFRAAGNLFGIVTGRPYGSIRNELKARKINYDFVISINGGYIVDHKGEIIHEERIPLNISEQICAQILKEDLVLGGVNDGIFVRYLVMDYTLKMRIARYFRNRVYLHRKADPNIVRGFVMHVRDASKADSVAKRVMDNFGEYISCHRNADIIIDLAAKGVAKDNAVQIVVDYFGAEEIYVIGDSFNDIGMIKRFNGFAVSGANEKVKAVASKEFEQFIELVDYIS
jgi:Predicted hydrolases of the HAD superfamily